MYPGDIFTLGVDAMQQLFRDVWCDALLIQGAPEADDAVDEINDDVRALHMALFAQKVDQLVFALVGLVQFGGYIAQHPLRSDLVEEYR